jgi:hypothetical protein
MVCVGNASKSAPPAAGTACTLTVRSSTSGGEDDTEFLIDIGRRRLVVDTTDGYAPDLEHIVAFARSATVPPR